MTDLISGLARFILRAVLVVAAVLFAASLVVVFLVLALFWLVTAMFAMLLGKPVVRYSFRMDPLTGFNKVFRSGNRSAAPAPAPAPREEPSKKDWRRDTTVTDVEPKDTKD